jgi:RNA polymerase sigma-70 factor, ECF subfamily
MLPLDTCAPSTIGETPGRPLVETVWIEPYPDERLGPEAAYEQREAVELAFVAALHHLAPLPRAVLLLRQVVGLSASETATALTTTVAGVNSALQRARKVIDERAPSRSQQATLHTLGDQSRKELLQRYMRAMEAADVDAVIELLVEDATWSMPPLSTWYSGHDAIRVFLDEHPLRLRWRHRPTSANGQAAVLSYLWDDEAVAFTPYALAVLTFDGPRIAAVDAFLGREVVDEFRTSVGSLPAEITT